MLHTILAEVTPPPTPTATDAMVQLITLVLLFAGMYFLIVAPQRQKQKELEKLLKELKKGDEVITLGGAYGTVVELSEDRVGVRLADKVVVEFQRSAIQAKVDPKPSQKKA